MATWKEDYLAALEARDETEKANIEIYEACTRMYAHSECHMLMNSQILILPTVLPNYHRKRQRILWLRTLLHKFLWLLASEVERSYLHHPNICGRSVRTSLGRNKTERSSRRVSIRSPKS